MKDLVYKLPQEFLNRLQSLYPRSYQHICETFLAKKCPSFRINYLKAESRALKSDLERERIKAKGLSWPKDAYLLKSELRILQKSFLYREGHIYVQNVSSMIPAIALSPQKGEEILDLCAAPGAKTTQIASLLGSSVGVTAVEKIRTRYYKLLANLKLQGAEGVTTFILDGKWARKKFPERFDKILLDAPCSSEGRFYVHNPRSFLYWKYRKVKEMAHKQKRLFAAAVHALKPGGILVYSTCTFAPEENEEIIDWALQKFKYMTVLPVEIPLSSAIAGIAKWRGKQFSQEISLTKRIIPNDFLEGFFIARLKKE